MPSLISEIANVREMKLDHMLKQLAWWTAKTRRHLMVIWSGEYLLSGGSVVFGTRRPDLARSAAGNALTPFAADEGLNGVENRYDLDVLRRHRLRRIARRSAAFHAKRTSLLVQRTR